ncbi:SRPBCC family protein [Actinokineospora globicatena]|uniref:SRPBCC family protein n=1 Tax=Actinokineospora globicatena TaxID=103729 RepID=UPI0020A5399C|nr:SRPBCC family protein [Actinokineospora globicatena]MCP2303688.1 Polyketide cyclase / dehydrase and lipid transport [Actinokineospora globicatena]GLW79174.1 hypothetical protein Aglo01_36560 [Actinokineospora globicatena]GLW86416.1 hypothetical protein Aglo02_40550 [Actinokineospora globicatena]
MTSHQYEAPVDLPAEQLFRYVADPANLPRFLTVVSEARATAPDRVQVTADVDGHHSEVEARFSTDEATRTIRWGSPGHDEYHGEFVVHEVAVDSSRVVVQLSTPHDDGNVERELAEAVAALTQGAAAQTDAERADQQDGWAG